MTEITPEDLYEVGGIATKWPPVKTCPECKGPMKHMAARYDYKSPDGKIVIPMLRDEADYRCENDDCGIIWCEDGACGA